VVKWHRQGFKLYWRGKSTRPKVGSIRRDCLDHVIVLSEAHLLRVLGEYFDYYHSSRPHLSLACNAPIKREIERPAPWDGWSPSRRSAAVTIDTDALCELLPASGDLAKGTRRRRCPRQHP